ncbi:hypothetical protein A3L11_07820 [Thermococcus siculi]|uniref:Uncharacterized protein n=1 Tax=Thermococcus siculi TaxID=72803 RepID=A0A2Z2MYP5_9EURY|nr:hypothetical protein [Thermococcus siculi]ASJ09140.1 hypothetical protein A3L11_07820 [Thermococcus siculi]
MGKETKLLEKIELAVPGYHGYKKKELMREDDRIIRGKVADILAMARKDMERALQRCAMVNCQQLVAIDGMRKKLIALESRVRHAEAGYSGYFDRIKVREDELNALIEYDAKLIELAQAIADAVGKLNGAIADPRNLGMAVFDLDDKLRELEETLDKRNTVLVGE